LPLLKSHPNSKSFCSKCGQLRLKRRLLVGQDGLPKLYFAARKKNCFKGEPVFQFMQTGLGGQVRLQISESLQGETRAAANTGICNIRAGRNSNEASEQVVKLNILYRTFVMPIPQHRKYLTLADTLFLRIKRFSSGGQIAEV